MSSASPKPLNPGDLLSGLSAADLLAYGLQLDENGRLLHGQTRFENPSCIYGHRLKNCTLGAFVYFNAAGSTSAYRVHFGRYSQIGESSVLGPPEHPQDWFSSHPFTFTRPQHMPNYYRMAEFERLAPEAQPGPSFADTMPNDTWIGHEAYVGVGSFVKRGVRIGDGATVGAHSVVTRDIPAYAVAVGSPARVLRLRFADNIVERLLALQWWRYDLAPFKHQVDYSKVEATLDYFEARKADGQLQELRPDSYRVERKADGFELTRLPQPLFFRLTPYEYGLHDMPISSPELFPKITELLQDFTVDWDNEFEGEMGPATTLLGDLGFESIDIIQLVVALEQLVGRRGLPFDKLLMKDSRYVDDLSVGQIADFLSLHS